MTEYSEFAKQAVNFLKNAIQRTYSNSIVNVSSNSEGENNDPLKSYELGNLINTV